MTGGAVEPRGHRPARTQPAGKSVLPSDQPGAFFRAMNLRRHNPAAFQAWTKTTILTRCVRSSEKLPRRLASLADIAEPLLAAARVLLRHEPNPGREVPP